CALDTGSAQKIKQMRRPTLQAVRMLLRKFCIPEANLVIGKDVQVLRERGKCKTPVCPGRSSWPRTMNEDDRASTACFVIIRVHTACTNEFSNLRCYRCLCHNTSCSSVLLLTLKLVSARASEHVPASTCLTVSPLASISLANASTSVVAPTRQPTCSRPGRS